MPTAREIDEAAAKDALRRTDKKPIWVAALGGLLLILSLAVASALAPKTQDEKGGSTAKVASPVIEAAPMPEPVVRDPASFRPARSLLLDEPPTIPPTAAETAAKAASELRKDALKKPAPAEAPSAVRVYVVLGGLCLAAIGVGWILKDRLRQGRAGRGKERLLIVRDQLALDQKRRVVVLGVEDRTLVVGVVGDQMTLLSEFSNKDESDVAPAAAVESPAVDERAKTPAETAAVEAPAVVRSTPAERLIEVVSDRVDVGRAEARRAAEARAAETRTADATARVAAAAAALGFGRPAQTRARESERAVASSPFRRIDGENATKNVASKSATRFQSLLESAAESAR